MMEFEATPKMCVNPGCDCRKDEVTLQLVDGRGADELHTEERASGLIVVTEDDEHGGQYL